LKAANGEIIASNFVIARLRQLLMNEAQRFKLSDGGYETRRLHCDGPPPFAAAHC
jgi:hypothetical protein